MKVSQSKVKMWRQCKFAYHCKHVEKLRKKTKSRPLTFGTLVHEMLEAHANGDDPFDQLKKSSVINAKLFDAEREMYGEIVEDIRTIMTEYFDHYKRDGLRYVRTKGKNAEHEFEIEISDGIVMVGKIDAIGRANKLKWIVEHKTFGRRMPTDDDRWRNLQSSVYIRALEMLGYGAVDGMLWDYIGSKPPTRPEILKSGELSRRKIVTLPSVVRRVLKDNGLSEKDYAEYIKLSEEGRRDYFQRVYSPVSRITVDILFEEFVDSAREIAEFHGIKKGRNIGLHCSYCDYEPICRATLQGSDADFVKEREYVISESKDEPAVVVEE